MATIKLGRLEEVDVRKLWSHEQYDFSNWLAKEENIELLNEALGLTLVDIEKEVYVGSYRCDLVASDETTGQKIIIENQLEQSNHDHLGKVITYASGLDAKVIVWIVKDAREEHRSAVEWLNNNTNKEINFFLIEIHAYKIGDSLYAPKFEIVEKPNDFIKTGKIQASSGEMNKSQSERLAFWTRFNEVIIERGRPFNVRKASTDHWYDVAIGTSAAHLGITLVNKENCIGIELYISDDKSIFDRLYAEKDVIEKELGLTLDWQRLDGKKASRIVYRISDIYVVSVEFYAGIGHKRLLMTKELQSIWRIRKNTKYDDKFYRLSKRLFKEEQFRSMTNEAKALYMILLDRRYLSECNGDAWRDEYGATFIIFTIKEMMKLFHLGNKKINKMLKELEAHNLIYRSHQGLRKPNKIYVYDLLKADNSNWLPKQFKHRKGQTNEKEIL